ncbi:GNAT family N-acetyltransferase [Actibacterium sp. MT2.3-13A]|uniref:GNAT family N-acetyltransferase n=1 Tax=Actibacterium sp. MT2.3-13A TaxID=2828332 RepID=UPI001BA83453|nr:GNAT family N-acetyltransferase [Actibacterium sp. MT2.3-13A]
MTSETLYAAIEATWPPAAQHRAGPWTLREGRGGGKRVSAATAEGPVTVGDLPALERAAADLGQDPLVMIRDGETALDALLEAAGYDIVDPVLAYAAPAAVIAREAPPPISTFTIWPPLAIMEELWEEGGIGPARRAVMERAVGPKTAVLGRSNDRAAGVAFVAIHGKIAFCHAVEVTQRQRRQKTACNMMRRAAIWAQDQGAETLAVLVTEANAPARALYASLGMAVVGHYHYRMKRAPRGQSS